MVTHTILVISVLAGYVANFERYGFDEESITAVELRDYDVSSVLQAKVPLPTLLVLRCMRMIGCGCDRSAKSFQADSTVT